MHFRQCLSLLLSFLFLEVASATERDELVARLLSSADVGVMFGHHDDIIYGQSWLDGVGEKSDVHDLCGKYPMVLSLDLSPIESGSKDYTRKCTFAQQRDIIIEHYNKGGIITLSWHMFNPLTGGTAWDVSSDSAVKAVLRKGVAQQHFFHYLDLAAQYLLSLRDAQGELIPIVFRPFHESQGSWFWWGASSCSDKQFVKLWRLVYNYLQKKGCSHLVYCFSLSGNLSSRSDYMKRFPGKKYVDVISTEVYSYEGEDIYKQREAFISNLRRNLSVADCIARDLGKPLVIGECGINGNRDSHWWSEALMPALEGYKVSYVNFWSNQHPTMLYGKGKTYCTYKGEASADDFVRVVNSGKLILLNR